MKKIHFPLAADTLFFTAASFLFSLALLRYLRVALGVACACAALIALAVGGIVFLVEYTKSKGRALSKQERESRDALMLHLALERDERVRAALLTALLADGKQARCEGECLLTEDGLQIPVFTMQPVDADEIARLIRRHGTEKFTLLCNDLTPEAAKLLLSFGHEAKRADDVYALFSRTQTTPDPLICGNIPRLTVKRRLRIAFSKSNARPFFTSGLLLLFMSLFTVFPLYYLISGGVLLLCALAVRIFGYDYATHSTM